MKRVTNPSGPEPVGPYSDAYITGNLVLVSGQLPSDPVTGKRPETIEEQAEQSCRNVEAVLQAAGTTIDKVVKTTCFLADMNDFAAFNKVYAQHFISKPVRSCIAVKDLPTGALCEIEAVAEL